jgi:hypothetical protein
MIEAINEVLRGHTYMSANVRASHAAGSEEEER